ncbi:MAG: hemolysin family protein [Lachnospiraceae bacterium]|nr:hemolysin family protein [Lachnospiraceae bacterium]
MSDDSTGKRERKRNKTSLADFFGIKNKDVTEEEILSMVDVGEENGSIEQNEKSRIENIFEFTDTAVRELMTHRTDIVALEDTATLDESVRLAIDTGYSRIPVYHEDIDNIIGVLYVKDLLKYVCGESGEDFTLAEITRKVPFVPRSKSCEELFAMMKENRVQMAVIADEYGGTEGLITLEDLVELILGNIQDEFDNEDEGIKNIGLNTFSVDGITSIENVEKLLSVKLSAPENCETLAAFILENLGRIPNSGEHPVVNCSGISFTVSEIDERRISKVLIVKNK